LRYNLECSNIELFEQIISSEESIELDFKKEHYKLIGGNEVDTAKFVKDITAFSNTIRENSAFIIIGILEENGEKELFGINNPIDDNILQSKIKDKVYPRPHFKYLNFEYQSKVFGIIEIPLRRYSEPIMPSVRMRGLEVGKVYCRQGSSNIEANGRETIQINNWITNLPENIDDLKIVEKISDLISQISSNTEPLSVALAQGLKIAKATDDNELFKFCKFEIEGYFGESINTEYLNHRKANIFMSAHLIENVQTFGNPGIKNFWNELKSKKEFYERTIVRNEGIHSIENTLNDFKIKGINSYTTEKRKFKDVFDSNDFGDMPFYFYAGFDTFNTLYDSIKKRYLKLLMKKI
jgi:hypothetical protein